MYLSDIRVSHIDAYNSPVTKLTNFPPIIEPETAQSSASTASLPMMSATTIAGEMNIESKDDKVLFKITANPSKFKTTSSIPVLQVGNQVFKESRFSADMTELTFILSAEKYAALKNNDAVKVTVGRKGVALPKLVK
jgi:hypothetical protein